MTALLTVDNLEVRFGDGPPAVRAARLSVAAGQTVAVVGESGSGKSTTAAAILGLLPPGGRVTGGTITFDGVDLTGADRRQLRAIRGTAIGFVPQDPMTNLNPVWKVGFQLRQALRANTVGDRRAVRQRAVALLAEAGMPDPATQAHRYPHQLSGGMCQRALIALGLAGRPRLLIADEPTSALDVTVQRQVLDGLQRLTSELGTAVLLITHDLALAAERAEELVVMHDGMVVETGPAQRVLTEPQHPYTRKLVRAAPSLAARRPSVVRVRPPAAEQTGQPLLAVTGLTKVYPGGPPWRRTEFRAVDDVSFTLARATTVAIAGESGSGKSTLARMVLGLLRPTAGTVVFDGQPITGLDRAAVLAFRRRVQPVFQNPYSSLDPMYSVFRIIEEPLRIHRIGDRRERDRAVRELADRVALPASVLDRLPRELSGGQRQRVAIARALALQPQLLVCDEAVSALDVVVQAQILDLLAELQASLGLAYLFISHDLAVIRQIADEVLVMRGGTVVEHAPTEAVFTAPAHDYTAQLLAAVPGLDGSGR
ncbi:dipeptide ABC transporter ATP-binding protein [Mycobacterium talmoniae]|uniref:ABC transporter ATP-binding protein n=1 Tax=Mycobacterium talmoniae TaxID=1858794 RepID=A0A1S1NLC9_9MYCO|nr:MULTISPECIES: ABC transporter ATP-binding protein [Mycobacterium]OHV03586.1 ABC transporter ATP-binding protein [Mycobacterium talmoniae]TDH56275.1 ABC transporter ATP-binding protein [Mycobacterium eburneum]